MKAFSDLQTFMEWRGDLPSPLSVGVVPTMGALHAGHRSLLERARLENDRVVMTLFVNRTQFNDARDYRSYPDTREDDLALARHRGVDAVLMPPHEALYADDYRFRVTEAEASRRMEGRARPGHFDGVLTVVLKLLMLTRPTRAYFGEKDFQQYQLVRDMASAFFVGVEIVPCPTVREPDGLACSSRNLRLSAEARRRAADFPRILREARSPVEARRQLAEAGFDVEYVEDVDGRRFGAAGLAGVRLIDNLALEGAGDRATGAWVETTKGRA